MKTLFFLFIIFMAIVQVWIYTVVYSIVPNIAITLACPVNTIKILYWVWVCTYVIKSINSLLRGYLKGLL